MERKGSKRFRRTRNIMQSLRRRLSFRKKKDFVPQSSKPYQWQEDEKKVREGSCSFQVRYLGCTEVFDSRGMYVCEEAVKALKSQSKGKCQRAVLYVSGDALRVVDEISKSMIVDQTIEKVSFCAPDRNHVKGFAYICRDGTTRRWMCHGFLAVKESGERLSHAVGCAFAICLEKKQKRDKETGVTVTFNQSRTSFERTGSFRQTTLTERIADPQSAILAEHVPLKSAYNPYAVQRPHASANLLERQGSFRGFEKLQETSSPFKRTLSLRLNELPSTLQRQNALAESPTQNGNGAVGGAIPEVSQEQEDSIAQMCQQLTQGLSALSTEDAYTSNRAHGLTHQASLPTPYTPAQPSQPMLTRQHTSPASQTLQPTQPVLTNRWPQNPTTSITTNNQVPTWGVTAGATAAAAPPSSGGTGLNPFASAAPSNPAPSALNSAQMGQQKQQLAYAHGRSHSIDSGEMSKLRWQQQASYQLHKPPASDKPLLKQAPNGTAGSASSSSNPWPTTTPSLSSNLQGPGADPFDVAWAAKSVNKTESTVNANPNPFGSKSVKQFEVQL